MGIILALIAGGGLFVLASEMWIVARASRQLRDSTTRNRSLEAQNQELKQTLSLLPIEVLEEAQTPLLTADSPEAGELVLPRHQWPQALRRNPFPPARRVAHLLWAAIRRGEQIDRQAQDLRQILRSGCVVDEGLAAQIADFVDSIRILYGPTMLDRLETTRPLRPSKQIWTYAYAPPELTLTYEESLLCIDRAVEQNFGAGEFTQYYFARIRPFWAWYARKYSLGSGVLVLIMPYHILSEVGMHGWISREFTVQLVEHIGAGICSLPVGTFARTSLRGLYPRRNSRYTRQMTIEQVTDFFTMLGQCYPRSRREYLQATLRERFAEIIAKNQESALTFLVDYLAEEQYIDPLWIGGSAQPAPLKEISRFLHPIVKIPARPCYYESLLTRDLRK